VPERHEVVAMAGKLGDPLARALLGIAAHEGIVRLPQPAWEYQLSGTDRPGGLRLA
jgi:hypothetical protein